jgi:hypothetical protein
MTIIRFTRRSRSNGTFTFTCFPFDAYNGSAHDGLFIPVLILSTPAFGTACVAVLFDTTTLGGTTAFGGAPTLSGAPAFGTDLIRVEVALDEAAPVLFEVAGAFRAVAFRSGTFTRFLTGPMPTSFLLFSAASLLASELGSKRVL